MHALSGISLPLFFLLANQQAITWFAGKAGDNWVIQVALALLLLAYVTTIASSFLRSGTYHSREAYILLALSIFGSLINSITIQFPQFSATFFLLGAYALLGRCQNLWPMWRKLLNMALLFSLIIPFYLEFSSGFGFGLRLLTAQIIENMLHTLGIMALSSHDIILTENAIAHIDIPCSGLKSLFFGNIFFLILMLVFRVSLSWRIAIPYLIFFVLLLSANITRVFVLTLLSVYNHHEIAQFIHVPLGIIGFGFSCLIAGWMLSLRYFRNNQMVSQKNKKRSPGLKITILHCLLVVQMMQGLVFPHSQASKPHSVNLPVSLHAEKVPLSSGEQRYFPGTDLTIAQKWKVAFQGSKGSLLIVQSQDFNRFHAPELCMTANGILVDKMQTIEISPGLKVRLLSLNKGRATGIYWLQSGTQTTDSFTTRYWRYLWLRQRDWSMVSMIVDQPFQTDPNFIKNIVQVLFKRLSEK